MTAMPSQARDRRNGQERRDYPRVECDRRQTIDRRRLELETEAADRRRRFRSAGLRSG